MIFTLYYLKEPTNDVFIHFLRSAGTVAISGEGIFGKQGNGRYLVTRNKGDVRYYRRRAEDLLSRARPLMKIYQEGEEKALSLELSKLKRKSLEFQQTTFKNINITIYEKQAVLVSKNRSPAIHFLIFHPLMVEAFEQFLFNPQNG